MTKYLLKKAATTKRRLVKHMLARLILALVLVTGTFHAPAIAHDDPASHHADHGWAAAHDAIADHHGDESPSHDNSGDSLHHHHCPTALDIRATDIALGVASAKTVLSFHRASPLTSFSQAPPTEPPAA